MNIQRIQIAGLTYLITSSVKLTQNYKPFFTAESVSEQIASVISIGDIPATNKKLCHHGLVIDDTKELYIYNVDEGSYYVTLNTKGSSELFELYAASTWDKITLSSNCSSPACHPSVIDIFMMLTFIYSAAYFNTVLLQSSCVKCGEDVVAFIGHSGAGKSTHSRLWLTHVPGTMLLNDDQPAVRVWDENRIVIYGTPWSGKTPCYINDQGLLKGIIRMKQAPMNKITALSPVALFQELLSSSSMIKADPTTFKQITSTLAKLASHIAGFVLENRPEKAAVDLVYTNTLKQI